MKKLLQVTAAIAFAVGLFDGLLPASAKPATRHEVVGACNRTKGCRIKDGGNGEGDWVIFVGDKQVGWCPGGTKVCYPSRTGAANVFPTLVPDNRFDHSGEGGNAQPQNGNGGNTDGGGQVGGPGR
jgi:hypothetical protein